MQQLKHIIFQDLLNEPRNSYSYILCDSGIGKHFESVKKEHKHKLT